MTRFRAVLAKIALTALATAFSACGTGAEMQTDERGGASGGSIRIGSNLPDSYDPVLFQTVQANQALQLVYTGLVTYRHAEGPTGNELVPGLAEAMPTVSADRRTYAFKLRQGLRYSDGTLVKASDFEHTIKRLTFLGGPFSPFMNVIQGVARYQRAHIASGDISGITTDDATGEIKIQLTAPDGKFLFALGLASTAPTPPEKSPFKAARPPGVGPYTLRVQNPTRQYVLTKAPEFNLVGIAKGNFDRITVIKQTVAKMTQDVIRGRLDFMTEDPSGDDLPIVKAKYADRFRMDPNPPNTHWFFMNQTQKPFDSLEVRRAVNYALDGRALQRIYGGRLQPTCNFLPPAYAGIGFQPIAPCPYGEPDGPSNLAMARRLVRQSGRQGTTVTVWSSSEDPGPAVIDYYRDVLNQIGFNAKTKVLDAQVYYPTIGLKSTKAQTGFNHWYQDFPHPADFFEPNLSKKALQSSPSFNVQQTSNPVIDRGLERLTPARDPAAVASEWAKLDRAVIDNADIALIGNELSTSFFSERMDIKNCSGVHTVYKNDWSLFCLK